MNVEYKDIEGFPNYKIGSDGTILSNKRKKGYINTFVGASGYRFATLYNNGKRSIISLHRLLATAFIPNPNNYPCINHKDENKLNNDLSNLEWCSNSYNRNYGTCEARRTSTMASKYSVAQFSLNGDFISIFPNCQAAAKSLNLGKRAAATINQCTLGRYKQSHGYIWKKVKPEDMNPNSQKDINDIIKELYNKVFPILSSYQEPLKKEYLRLKEYCDTWEKEHKGEECDSAVMRMWAISAPLTAMDILNELY